MEGNIAVLVLLFITGTGKADGYLITNCDPDNGLRFEEYAHYVFITCEGITDKKMFWDLTRPDGTTVDIARCVGDRWICNILNSDLYSATRYSFESSELRVKKDLRTSILGEVRCGGRRRGKKMDAASCKVHIYSPAKIRGFPLKDISTSRWTLTWSYDVEEAYSSDGQYLCLWDLAGQQVNRTYDLLSNYSDNGHYNVRGKCTIHSHPLPTVDGNYTYQVKVTPLFSFSNFTNRFVLHMQRPKFSPTLSCCPDMIMEGDDVTCRCEAADSSPRTGVTWTDGGQWDDPLLRLTDVSYTLDGKVFTCVQNWGGVARGYNTTVTYVLRVKRNNATTTTTTTASTIRTTTTLDGDSYLGQAILVVGIIGGIIAGIVGTLTISLIVQRKGDPSITELKVAGKNKDSFFRSVNTEKASDRSDSAQDEENRM